MQHDHCTLHEQQRSQQHHQQHQLLIQSKSKVGLKDGSGGGGGGGGGITGTGDHKVRQKRFAQQRSILKNSTERSSNHDEQDLLEAKKQLILRRRRLFSHYRQYEQWRRRQFSYDPCYYRATPLPIGQSTYAANTTTTINYAGGYGSQGQGAFRRRRQYRRQYSCAEREDSRESRESSSLRRYKGESMIASDSFNTDSANFINCEQQHEMQQLQQQQQQQQTRQQHRQPHQQQQHELAMLQQQQKQPMIDCYSPMGRRSHFHMMHEERSASISERCTRSRINSAIFVSAEGGIGFDSIEFLQRHGSQSVLCRKARSAENITDNERKQSFSDNKRTWRNGVNSNHDPNASKQDDCDGSAIELRECRSNVNGCNVTCGGETRTLSVLTTNTSCDHPSTSAAAAASLTVTNLIVGSISLETPPSHIKDELHNSNSNVSSNNTSTVNTIVTLANGEKRQRPNNFTGMSKKSSTSRDSNDTAEELVLVPTTVAAIADLPLPEITVTNRSRALVRQRSSTASISPHRSPKTHALKHARPKITALPMVSVSGPSPPHEKPPSQQATECL